VTEHEFMASALWQSTLEARDRQDDHAHQRARLRTSYLSLREHAAVLMGEAPRDALQFTVHDINHVDALWETADLVCGSENRLTPAEAYVLGCAFVLHDAAMSLAAYKEGLPAAVGEQEWRDLLAVTYFNHEGNWPTPEQLDAAPESVVDSCYAQAIRETHPAHAKRLVDQQWESSAGNQLHLIQDTGLREAYGPLIGDLAASHWWDVNDLVTPFKRSKGSLSSQPAEWIIDPLKLACILRLADATQIDSRRAPTFLLALRQPKGQSLRHWRFQEHMSRPRLHDDRVTFTAMRPFDQEAADAWWLALTYLRDVDLELKKVDALLHDLGRARLAARAVAGVDSEERFAELFPVSGWRPVDAVLQISDTTRLVETLGGRQLYGNEPDVAVRELIQNAHDAVLARRTIDADAPDGRVDVRLIQHGDQWTLEVQDNGIGMDEGVLVHGLLDFGRTGWSTEQVRLKFPGLAGGGFQPKGRFGIGFFSVFMLGDDVEIVTRRYDAAATDARRLRFDCLNNRPILSAAQPSERPPQGTVIRVKLKNSPYDTAGIFRRAPVESLIGLVNRLVLENSVPIHTSEVDGAGECVNDIVAPFALATGSAEDVFDRLYPPRTLSWQTSEEKQRLMARERFALHATRVYDDQQRPVGLAAFNGFGYRWSRFYTAGVVSVNGFRAEELPYFAGYFEGRPNRASRDVVDLTADAPQISRWLESQEHRKRELGIFTPSVQVDLASTIHSALGTLPDDNFVGMASEGLLRFGELGQWAAGRTEIFLATGWPLSWNTYAPEPRLWHWESGVDATKLPENWLMLADYISVRPFTTVFPLSRHRDPRFEYARADREPTWQKRWWYISGELRGVAIQRICEVWGCDVGEVLAPVADRHWEDEAEFDNPELGRAAGYWIRHPRPPASQALSS
jgi:hypothetical protein